MAIDLHQGIVDLLPRLRRFAYSLCGSRDEADDLVQTACVKALSRLDQFEQGTRLDSWLVRIVHTTWIDRGRGLRRRPLVDDPEALHSIPFDARVHEQTQAREELEIVRAEMARMPDEQRSALALVAIEGLSYQEAADLLEVPVGTVVSRLSRARKRLSSVLEKPGPQNRSDTRQ